MEFPYTVSTSVEVEEGISSSASHQGLPVIALTISNSGGGHISVITYSQMRELRQAFNAMADMDRLSEEGS